VIFIDGLAGLFGDLEADRAAGFLLAHRGALHCVAMGCDILDFQANHIAAPKFAVDSEIEQRKIAYLALHLQPGADRPDVLGLQGRFRANELALIPRPADGVSMYVLNSYPRSLSIYFGGDSRMMDAKAGWIVCLMTRDKKEAVSWNSVKAGLRDFDRTALLGLIQVSEAQHRRPR
jgi:hypothetical protein